MRLVLASTSQRRAALLDQCGLEFERVAVDIDETRRDEEPPVEYVERLALAKAMAGAEAVGGSPDQCVVVGADTIVVHQGRVLGKPGHPDEARRMLQAISGQSHIAMTGVAVVGGTIDPSVASDTTLVRFADLTAAEIDAYILTGEPMDKAGAYGLQGAGGMFVERIEGSPSTVVGLPLHLVGPLLRRHGVAVLSLPT